MDPLANPYRWSGNPPPALTGREGQEAQFETLLGRLRRGHNEQSMIVFGLRGVGMRSVAGVREHRGCRGGSPLTRSRSVRYRLRSDLADAAYEALSRLNRRKALGDGSWRSTGYSRDSAWGIDYGKVEFSFDPEAVGASTGDLERDLTQLLVELGEAAEEHDTGVVFLINEMSLPARGDRGPCGRDAPHLTEEASVLLLLGRAFLAPGLMVEAVPPSACSPIRGFGI